MEKNWRTNFLGPIMCISVVSQPFSHVSAHAWTRYRFSTKRISIHSIISITKICLHVCICLYTSQPSCEIYDLTSQTNLWQLQKKLRYMKIIFEITIFVIRILLKSVTKVPQSVISIVFSMLFSVFLALAIILIISRSLALDKGSQTEHALLWPF